MYDPMILNSDIYNYEYFQQDDVCRLCWNRNAYTQIIDLSSDDNFTMKTDLVDKILDCLNIDLTRNTHPSKACDECCKQIDNFHYFKKFCQETDRKLQEITNTRKNEQSEQINIVKVEDIDEISDNLEEFLDSIDSDGKVSKINRKTKIKSWKYKPKRTPTYCNMCMTDYESVEKFKNHKLQFHGIESDGSFKCFGCEKKFKNRKNRFCHEANFCKGLKDGYKCHICERYLPKRRMYEAHMRDHRENVPIQLPEEIFKCQKCDKLFRTMEDLKSHTGSEHDEDKNNYVCESCGRVFTRKDYLNKHKLTHTGEKQHVCPHCGFRTIQRSSLIVHIRKHTGERPYRCNICPQRCVSSSNLRAHQQRHLGVKVHECNICHKRFGYKVSLQEHMMSHAPAQTLSCTQCGAQYTHARGLRRHIAAKHATDV